MKLLIHAAAILALAAFGAQTKPADAKPAKASAGKSATGAIVKFECGDNCYLTIKPAKGKEITGLCAKACAPWASTEDMPPDMVGRIVTVTLGKGAQRDASGVVQGHMTEFKTLKLKPETAKGAAATQ